MSRSLESSCTDVVSEANWCDGSRADAGMVGLMDWEYPRNYTPQLAERKISPRFHKCGQKVRLNRLQNVSLLRICRKTLIFSTLLTGGPAERFRGSQTEDRFDSLLPRYYAETWEVVERIPADKGIGELSRTITAI
jgi:hypothetical protein